jgi:hypothetical protein
MNDRSRTPDRARRAPQRWAPGLGVAAGIIGLLALAMVPLTYTTARSLRERHDLVARLPDLAAARDGELAVLDGRIAATVPLLHGPFVAYLREEYTARQWRATGGRMQPLVVETTAGPVEVVNADYTFDQATDDWAHATEADAEPTATRGAIRTRGLVPGQPLMIVARPTGAGSPRRVTAVTVVGLDRRRYLARLERAIAIRRTLGLALAAIAAGGIAVGVWTVRRTMRSLAASS